MALYVYKNASVTVNGVDLSDHVKSATVKFAYDEVEATAMSNAAHYSIPGLQDWSIDVEFHQDHATSKVDQTLAPLVGGSTFVVVVKQDSGAVAATNPSYTGTARLFEYTPISGSVGDGAATSVTFKSGNGTVLARATA